ncbi:hypothetical protein NKG94_07455 [Micromonospora sp. M12]
MAHLESVRADDLRRSHWIARGPAGHRVEWDAEIIDDQPNKSITWRSLPGTRCPTPAGSGSCPPPATGAPRSGWSCGTRRRPARSAGRWRSSSARNPSNRSVTTCAGSSRCWRPVRSSGRGQPNGISVRQQAMQRPAQPLPASRR